MVNMIPIHERTRRVAYRLVLFVALMLFSPPLFASGDGNYIEFSRRSRDSEDIKQSVLQLLGYIPSNIRKVVFESGCRIVIVPMVSEYISSNYSDRPRGYSHGGGYDNADGLFMPSRNQLLISEKVSFLNGAPRRSSRIPYVLRHEFGHAYDYYLGRKYKSSFAVSDARKFLETHRREVAKLTNTDRSKLEYFCQNGAAGASETFAELFYIRCAEGSHLDEMRQKLVHQFPETRKLVESAMTSPEMVRGW